MFRIQPFKLTVFDIFYVSDRHGFLNCISLRSDIVSYSALQVSRFCVCAVLRYIYADREFLHGTFPSSLYSGVLYLKLRCLCILSTFLYIRCTRYRVSVAKLHSNTLCCSDIILSHSPPDILPSKYFQMCSDFFLSISCLLSVSISPHLPCGPIFSSIYLFYFPMPSNCLL